MSGTQSRRQTTKLVQSLHPAGVLVAMLYRIAPMKQTRKTTCDLLLFLFLCSWLDHSRGVCMACQVNVSILQKFFAYGYTTSVSTGASKRVGAQSAHRQRAAKPIASITQARKAKKAPLNSGAFNLIKFYLVVVFATALKWLYAPTATGPRTATNAPQATVLRWWLPVCQMATDATTSEAR